MIFIVLNVVVADDLELNYIRGTIYLANGSPAPSGAEILVLITAGKSAGFNLTIHIDDKSVPAVLYGRGYYSTGDSINFNTNDTFKIIADNGTHEGSVTGSFITGGNGMWGSDAVNIIISEPYNPEEIEEEILGIGHSNYTQDEIFPSNMSSNVSKIINEQTKAQENQSNISEINETITFVAAAANNFSMTWFLILIVIIIIIIVFYYKQKKKKK